MEINFGINVQIKGCLALALSWAKRETHLTGLINIIGLGKMLEAPVAKF